MDVLTVANNKRAIIALDDIKVRFFEETKEIIEKQFPKSKDLYESELLHSVGDLEHTGEIGVVEATISSLENSIDSLTPKVPIIPEKKLEKLKDNAKIKLTKKTVREELKDVHYDKNPELANLENTIILNADVLKKDMVTKKNDKDDEKMSKCSKIIIFSLFVILILFACSIPLLIKFL